MLSLDQRMKPQAEQEIISEKIDVFQGDGDLHRIKDMAVDFEALWTNATAGLEVVSFPKAVKDKILSYRKDTYSTT